MSHVNQTDSLAGHRRHRVFTSVMLRSEGGIIFKRRGHLFVGGPEGSGLLMTRLYKENAESWAPHVSVLTLLVLNSSKTAMPGPIFMI